MNKKLILAAIAVGLTASCAQATNITGITGNNGVYNITPEHYSGIAGYRKYDNFNLSKGHIANLMFDRDGGKTQPTAFVNLVRNGVNINGIVNTTKGGNFYNGHAIFITPGGFIVGSSGVLNVGKLSVATPTAEKYNKLLKDSDNQEYGDANFHYEEIGRQVSALTQNSKGESGASNITIQGKVFARNGVEMGGKAVAVSGNVFNGVKDTATVLETEDQATALFESLVNTNGYMKSANFVKNGSRILVKSTEGMAVSGTVQNGAGDVYLTNNGANGLNVSGLTEAAELNRLYSTKGDLRATGEADILGKKVVMQNKGENLTLGANTAVQAQDRAEILNYGAGRLNASGTIMSGKDLAIQNKTGSGMTVEGNISSGMAAKGETAIHNYNGDMIINGKIENIGNMGIINEGSGAVITKNANIENVGKLKIANTGADGLTFVGDINNDGEIRIYNDNGKLTFGKDSAGEKAAQITNKNGKLYIAARKNSTGIMQSTDSKISNENGNLVIRNSGTKSPTAEDTYGMNLQGAVYAKNGTVAINNDFGNMYVSSDVKVENGNLGIINRAKGGNMTLASAGKINVLDGNANLKNYGLGNMVVNSEITHNGRVNVIANSGALQLGSKVHNNSGALSDNGGFYAASRLKGTGINVTSEFVVDGNGEVLIKNISGEDGLRYNGKINTTGHQAALVNHKGNMDVYGDMTTKGAPVIISNKGNKLTVYNSANLNSGTEGKLVNTGSEAMTIGPSANIVNIKKYEQIKK